MDVQGKADGDGKEQADKGTYDAADSPAEP